MLHAALTISPSAATAGPNIPLAWLPHPALSHIYWIKPSPSLSIASHPLSPLHGYIPSVDSGLDWGYEHDGTSAKPARRPGFGAGPPGIARTASSSTSHPDAGRLRHALRGPQPLRDSSMGPPARCRHGAGHGFHPAQDASGGQPSYRIPSAGRGRLRDRSGRVEPGGTAGRERHCGGRQSPAGDSRPRVARGAPGGRICSRIQPGGRAKGGWGRYRGN